MIFQPTKKLISQNEKATLASFFHWLLIRFFLINSQQSLHNFAKNSIRLKIQQKQSTLSTDQTSKLKRLASNN